VILGKTKNARYSVYRASIKGSAPYIRERMHTGIESAPSERITSVVPAVPLIDTCFCLLRNCYKENDWWALSSIGACAGRLLRPVHHRTDSFSRTSSTERGAKMGQTIRQSMQPDACAHYSQQPQAYPPKKPYIPLHNWGVTK